MIDDDKQQLGVMTLGDALRLANSKGLDLIEIAPTATPPVCRIVDYGKFRYEESKRQKESNSRQSGNKMKELQLSPVIDPHDFGVKLAHAIDFLSEGMTVLVKLRFRGRQRAHKEFGFEVMNKFVTDTAAYGQADAPPKMLGERDLNVIIRPLSREKRAKHTQDAKTPDRPHPADHSPNGPAESESASSGVKSNGASKD